MKLEYIVVFENISDRFDKGHCGIKVKVTVGLEIFPHLPQYKLAYIKHVCSSDNNTQYFLVLSS